MRRRHLQLNLTGGRLEPGDTVFVVYGDDVEGARAQPWVTDAPPAFAVEVDRTGGGTYVSDAVVPVAVEPGPPAHLHVVVPSGARPGASVPIRVRVLDEFGNLCSSCVDDARLPDGRTMAIRDGRADAEMRFIREGVHRIEVAVVGCGLRGRSNPCRVAADGPVPCWGDPHVHTNISDGVGSPAFALAYGRDVACLDFVAITDHDVEFHHGWFTRGQQRLSDADWAALAETIARHRVPGRFATLRAYEWTGRPYGDRCIYLRSDHAPLYRYELGDAPTPDALWQRLRAAGLASALVVPHTTASGFMGTDWAAHDGDLERLVEIYSMHGASECADGPTAMAGAVPGRYVRDFLARGYRVGFTGGGDMHSSQPGNPLLAVGPYRTLRHRAGLTAVFADRVDEVAIFDAMRRRRTYATTGARILLEFTVYDASRGAPVALAAGGPVIARGAVYGTALLAEVTVVRNGQHVYVAHPQQEDFTFEWRDPQPPLPGTYYYLRAVQADGHVAWSSPIWIDGSREDT
ncbi:MAG: CehA/McbA family metallohydrolase [Armatimonadota bacterium]|nr:CehA/McbA family metallohydrolase [Armatimonadota bacterium]MDR7548806.1 CehA/McbA family metallohydrolase [Armatimonadota bacterium]